MSIDGLKSPNVFHPTKPSAVGSRNSLVQEGRSQKGEFDQLIAEETDKVLNNIETKLPTEVLEKLEVMGGIKEKLYTYYNQNYQNMFNRFMVTSEDELVKKVRSFVDKEETKTLARYTPKEIAELLDQVAGADKFNTGEVEKSIVNMYGHLQGHVQRGVNDLENETNALLRQKTDVGAFIRGENAYAIVKCSFKDNAFKKKTVSNVKLSINVLDSELISPIIQYQTSVENIIKDQISKTLLEMIEREIEAYQDQLVDEGKDELSDAEVMFEKIKRIPDFTDDEKENPQSKRYIFMAKNLLDKIEGLRAEIDPAEFDPQNIRENIKAIVDIENIRNRGFNTAINSLTSILDTSKMGYQYIENLKNARELVLREYEDTDVLNLPDERYQMRLKYYDNGQLIKARAAYMEQLEEFQKEIVHLWDVTEVCYQSEKKLFRVNDFDDLAKKSKNKIRKTIKDKTGDPLYEEQEHIWNELVSLKAEDTDVERLNQTCLHEKDLLKAMIRKSREKVQKAYGFQHPRARVVLDERIDDLEISFENWDYVINPYHVNPGLLLDVDITSIKRKKFTLNSMANVLNEFLNGVSKGFADAAFATYKRRRSTVRDDINQSFSTLDEDSPVTVSSTMMDQMKAADVSAPAPKKSGGKKGGKKKGGKQVDLSEI